MAHQATVYFLTAKAEEDAVMQTMGDVHICIIQTPLIIFRS
jgi:hypothetical protein